MAKRLQAMGQPNYRDGFAVRTHAHMLEVPLRWSKPRMVFVNSMGDLFHEEVETEFIKAVFEVMRKASRHTFQVLTKRADRLQEVAAQVAWPSNVWMGVTVEDDEHLTRVEKLRTVPAALRFLSVEPLLGPLPHLDPRDIDWVIVGVESGPGARPMDEAWALGVRDACIQAQTPFFFKQWGGVRKKAAGRELQQRIWDQMPFAV